MESMVQSKNGILTLLMNKFIEYTSNKFLYNFW